MAFQGEHFVARYGTAAAQETPPIRRMLDLGIPVGAGTDATRVASYDPFVALAWLVTGKSLGGLAMTPPALRMDRTEALRLWTEGSAWFSGEESEKGRLAPGRLADLAVLSADYFVVPESEIARLASVLTVVGGRVVHASDEFAALAPALPPPSPSWSPNAAPPADALGPVARASGCPCAFA
jgi:predicted amidohydrolase YtcJ